MDLLSTSTLSAVPQHAIVSPMAKRTAAAGKRYFVKLSDDAKRRLDFLAVDAGAESTEAYGGRLLTEAIERLWQSFDPKGSAKASDKRKPPRP